MKTKMANGRLRQDIWLAFGAGLVFSCLASIARLGGGAEAFSSQGLSYPRLVVAYPLTGLVAGTVFGYLRPFARSTLTRFVVGSLAAVPAAVGLTIGFVGSPMDWGFQEKVVVVFFEAFFTVGMIEALQAPVDVS